jgi:soluble lytic murein transglycosylase-like protein
MQTATKVSTFHAASIVAVLGAVAGLTSQLVPSVSAPAAGTTAASAVAATSAVARTSAAAAVAAVAAAAPSAVPAVRLAAPAAAAAVAFASEEALRAQIKWVPVRYGGEKLKTLDDASRILLAQAAAHRAGLDKVGLSFVDVYGVIDAETSWIPRSGMGRNGVQSMGLAQFEPRTAKGLGLKNPNDPVQAVYYAAINMKHGAEWAEDKIAHLKLSPEQRAAKIREGVSVYYNLSVKGRNKWDGINTAQLPFETQRHITNVREGAEKAAELADDILG